MDKKLPAVRNDLSLVPFRLTAQFNAVAIGNATGFVYSKESRTYLITNWHVVTGRHPENGNPIDSTTLAVPDKISITVPFRREEVDSKKVHVWWEEWMVNLYDDAERKNPRWFEHPIHGQRVDAIALPFDLRKEHIGLIAANAPSLGLKPVVLYPSLSVYVLGYPLGLAGGLNFPIWKRGTIASEPEFPLDGLPKVYIDAATRKGMSGAPVYVDELGSCLVERADGSHIMQLGGRGRRFVGIYASRDGFSTEFEAQLGTVWKANAIDEIIDGRKAGTSSFWTTSLAAAGC